MAELKAYRDKVNSMREYLYNKKHLLQEDLHAIVQEYGTLVFDEDAVNETFGFDNYVGDGETHEIRIVSIRLDAEGRHLYFKFVDKVTEDENEVCDYLFSPYWSVDDLTDLLDLCSDEKYLAKKGEE